MNVYGHKESSKKSLKVGSDKFSSSFVVQKSSVGVTEVM